MYYLSYSVFNEHCNITSAMLVGSSGLEPPTSRLSGARSNQLSYEPEPRISVVKSDEAARCFGKLWNFEAKLQYSDGDDGIRTHDPLLAGQVLSQLSYTPTGLQFLCLRGPAH